MADEEKLRLNSTLRGAAFAVTNSDVAYICDCKLCAPEVCADSECTHTTDIRHAANVDSGKPMIFEKLPDGRLWETLRESQE